MKKIMLAEYSKLRIDQLLKRVDEELKGNDSELLLEMKPTLQTTMDLCEKLKKYKRKTQFQERGRIIFVFHINNINTTISKIVEPHAPYAMENLISLKYTFRNGYRTSVKMEPIIDNNLIELIYRIKEFITDFMFVDIITKKYIDSIIETEIKQLMNGVMDYYLRPEVLEEIHTALSENNKIVFGNTFPVGFQNDL